MAPSANAVTETAAIYLARRGMQLAELAELRTGVEVAITDLAAQRIDDEGIAILGDALTREANATDAERGRGRPRPARGGGGHGAQPGAGAGRARADPPEPPAPDRTLGPEGPQRRSRPRCSGPTRASPLPSRQAIESWLATACAVTSRRSAHS